MMVEQQRRLADAVAAEHREAAALGAARTRYRRARPRRRSRRGRHRQSAEQRLSHGALRRDRPRARADRAAISSGVPSIRMRPPTMTMMRLAKRNTRFMSCSMNRTVMSRGKLGDGREQFRALFARHAGGRLVEQQHLRPRRQRERNLEQPLLAIGELARRPVADRCRAAARQGSHGPPRSHRG